MFEANFPVQPIKYLIWTNKHKAWSEQTNTKHLKNSRYYKKFQWVSLIQMMYRYLNKFFTWFYGVSYYFCKILTEVALEEKICKCTKHVYQINLYYDLIYKINKNQPLLMFNKWIKNLLISILKNSLRALKASKYFISYRDPKNWNELLTTEEKELNPANVSKKLSISKYLKMRMRILF